MLFLPSPPTPHEANISALCGSRRGSAVQAASGLPYGSDTGLAEARVIQAAIRLVPGMPTLLAMAKVICNWGRGGSGPRLVGARRRCGCRGKPGVRLLEARRRCARLAVTRRQTRTSIASEILVAVDLNGTPLLTLRLQSSRAGSRVLPVIHDILVIGKVVAATGHVVSRSLRALGAWRHN